MVDDLVVMVKYMGGDEMEVKVEGFMYGGKEEEVMGMVEIDEGVIRKGGWRLEG